MRHYSVKSWVVFALPKIVALLFVVIFLIPGCTRNLTGYEPTILESVGYENGFHSQVEQPYVRNVKFTVYPDRKEIVRSIWTMVRNEDNTWHTDKVIYFDSLTFEYSICDSILFLHSGRDSYVADMKPSGHLDRGVTITLKSSDIQNGDYQVQAWSLVDNIFE